MTDTTNQKEVLKKGFRNSILIKVISIGILVLLLLIPTTYVTNLIEERALRREEVIKDVSSKWGSEQIIGGPVLTIPFMEYTRNLKGDVIEKYKEYAHFTPEALNIDGNIGTEVRKRSIYEVVLYNSNLKIQGNFKPVDFNLLSAKPELVLWEEAFISMGIPDLTGLNDKMNVNWNEKSIPFNAGIPSHDVFRTGVHAMVPVEENQEISFSLDLDINGSERLAFVPIGQSNEINLSSKWTEPSFDGNFLPSERKVNDTGFTATWNVFDLNRNLRNQWAGPAQNIYESTLGVSLIIPVNEYQKNMRSTKYALLIICLTFLTFFLAEVINKNLLHTFHYVLAGLALVIFYVLLLSFTEHIGFNLAYLVSALMTITSVVLYVSAIVKNRVFTMILASFFALIYTFVYVILQLQDFSLLVGSIGLFAALSATMYLTRNIDWFSIGKPKTTEHAVVN